MASKAYEVIFQFRAQADAAIGQFKNVSDTLEAVRDRAAALQDALAQIENFRAYSQSVAATSAKLEELKAREQEAKAALEEATAARKAAESEVERHSMRVTELRAAIRNENAEHGANMAMLKGAKASEAEIAEEKLRHKLAVEALTRELGQEQTALETSKRARQNAVNTEKDAENAKKSATAAAKEAAATLEDERARLEATDQALKNAQVDTARLADEERRLRAEAEEAAGEMERLREQAEKTKAFQETVNNIRAMAQAMDLLADAARPVWNLMTDTVESAAALEKQISVIRAISGATLEETEALTRQIRRTGATTVFTAEEAAGAMQTMALAGWDAQQMIAGLPGVVGLAAAAGEDLTQMTSIVADGMNAFQLQGTEAATKFADVLAKTATSSNTNVGLIGESLSYVETTAGNLGYSIEDVSVALAAMANNALKGSVAGSSLNTTLTRMSGANATAKKQMEEMGLSMYDTATGQAKPLLQFMEELRTAFRDFGDDAQAAQIAAYRLAGQRGMRGLLAIVNQSDEQWQKLVGDIYSYQGAAEQISTTRLENYAGKLQLLSDAWTDLKITIGNQLLPVATDAVETLTDLTDGANGLLETAQPLALWAAGTSGAILGMSKVMSAAATTAQGLYFIMKLLPEGTKLTTVLGGFGAAGLAAVAAGGLLALFGSDAYQSTLAGTRYLRELEGQLEETAELSESSRVRIENAATPEDRLAELNAIDSSYDSALETQYEQLRDAYKQRDEFVQHLKEIGRYGYRMDTITGEDVLDVGSMTRTERDSLQAYNEAIERTRAEISRLGSERVAYHEMLTQQFREENGLQKTSLEQYEAIETALGELGGAWAEVWQETYTAYSGVFGLFEQVEQKSASIDDMTAALEEQSSYWEVYAANLNTLRTAAENAGIDIGGLWEALGAQGDTQSAAYIQEIVDSLGDLQDPDTSKLAELVGLYENVIGLKAEAVSAFSEQDDRVQSELAEFDQAMKAAIEETESYDEARQAMLLTLDGYTDTLEQEGNTALYAVKRLGEKLRDAIYPEQKNHNPNGYAPISALKGYASGTENAAPGLALVGERGPELLIMRGGEQVIPAGETSRLLRLDEAATGGGAVNQFSVNVTVQGNASAETVQDLRDYGKELEAAFRRMLREQQMNAQRRAYR